MSLANAFELVLFHTTYEFDRAAVTAGVPTLIVDWERRGKQERQGNYDTQINAHTLADLKQARSISEAHLVCRLNGWHEMSPTEIKMAIEAGADEVLLPMVRSLQQAEQLLQTVAGQCLCSLMLETQHILALAPQIAQLPLARVYVGLNDLSIDRQDANLFVPVADGTVERLRAALAGMPFGFGGLTLPTKGYPVPSRLLIDEMMRLHCNFSFLRRTFVHDMRDHDLRTGVDEIKNALQTAKARSTTQVEADHAELLTTLQHLPPLPWKIG